MTAHQDPAFAAINQALASAAAAAPQWAVSSAAERAALLRGLANMLEDHQPELVALADEETGLGSARLNGEVARTAFQLRGFATEVEAGTPFKAVDDAAIEGAPPLGRPRLTRIKRALGPVAMFSASNFPFAFSVLGGDTASALAAGCPVVVKAHAGHAGLSRRVFELALQVILQQGQPAGLLTFLDGLSRQAGTYLVQHPQLAAVAFTGSYQGGKALWQAANDRPLPIPFYGELGSINPLIALPAALQQDSQTLASQLAASITLGCGQFCTSPGVILVDDSALSNRFIDQLATALAPMTPHRMLTDGVRKGFEQAAASIAAEARQVFTPAADGAGPAPRLFITEATRFISSAHLREEMFGPAALIVRASSIDEMIAVLQAIAGTLTTTLWGADEDNAANRALVQAAQQIAGRVLFRGVPTGVAVCHAQQHGGPWPSSTAPQSTSVGYAAIERFLRPVALQDAPDWLLN